MGFRPRLKSDCSIRSSRPKRAGPVSDCRSRQESWKNTAAHCNIRPSLTAEQPLALYCRRQTMMKPSARILLIEDDEGAAGSLAEVLTAEGYAVSLARRGDEGLAQAQAESFDIVLTDLRLPGLGGLDLVRQLNGTKPRLPIILMTAHGTTETAIEATKFGAFDYLLKPFEMEELLELVGKEVAGSRLMSEPVEIGATNAARDALVGQSRNMHAIYKEIGRV